MHHAGASWQRLVPETMHLVLVRPGEFEGTSKKRTTTGQYIMHNVLLSSTKSGYIHPKWKYFLMTNLQCGRHGLGGIWLMMTLSIL